MYNLRILSFYYWFYWSLLHIFYTCSTQKSLHKTHPFWNTLSTTEDIVTHDIGWHLRTLCQGCYSWERGVQDRPSTDKCKAGLFHFQYDARNLQSRSSIRPAGKRSGSPHLTWYRRPFTRMSPVHESPEVQWWLVQTCWDTHTKDLQRA